MGTTHRVEGGAFTHSGSREIGVEGGNGREMRVVRRAERQIEWSRGKLEPNCIGGIPSCFCLLI